MVQPSVGKLWRLKYRISGKEKKIELGTYPGVGPGTARNAERKAITAIEVMQHNKNNWPSFRPKKLPKTPAKHSIATIAFTTEAAGSACVPVASISRSTFISQPSPNIGQRYIHAQPRRNAGQTLARATTHNRGDAPSPSQFFITRLRSPSGS